MSIKVLPARMKDGTPIKLAMEDKGTRIPGFRKDGTRFEAYTTWFRAMSGKFAVNPEIYSQVSKKAADESGDAAAFRLANYDLCLEAIGVDPSSLDLGKVMMWSEYVSELQRLAPATNRN